MARKLVVEIIGDDSSLRKALARSSKETKQFQATVTKTGTSLRGLFAGGIAGVGVGAFFKQATSAASDLNEQMSKNQVVFGQSAATITRWSQTTAASLGLSQRAALATASSFGALFQPMGIVGAEAADQSKQLTQLGSDLASFYNTDVKDALDAIRSGLVGESEPLRRYGVLLSETRVQSEAMAETGKRVASQLTDQEKVLARINLIFRDTTKAQGDFSRTSEGLANQQRILTAQIDDLKTGLGEALLPAITDVVSKFNEWLEDPQNKQKVIDGWTTAINNLAAAAVTAGAAITSLVDARNKVKNWPGKGPSGIEIFKGIYGAYKPAVTGILGDLGLYSPGRPGLNVTGMTSKDFAGASGLVSGLADVSDAVNSAFRDTAKAVAAATRTMSAGGAGGPAGVTAAQRNQWFDNMISRLLGRASDPVSLRAQISRLQTISGLIQQRLNVTKDITRQQRLQDEIADIAIQIRDRRQQIAANRQAARDRARDQAAANMFELVPVDRTALQALAPSRVNALIRGQQARRLRRQLGWAQFALERAETTKGIGDDLKAARRIERILKELIGVEGRTLEGARDLWQIRDKMRDLNKQKTDEFTKTRQLSNRQITNILAAGLGLDAGGRSRLLFNVAKSDVALNVGVEIDGREVGRAVRKDTSRTGYRTSRQTSGFRG